MPFEIINEKTYYFICENCNIALHNMIEKCVQQKIWRIYVNNNNIINNTHGKQKTKVSIVFVDDVDSIGVSILMRQQKDLKIK